MLIKIIIIIALFGLSIYLFMNHAPQFGAQEPILNKERIEKTENYSNGVFYNNEPYTKAFKDNNEKFTILDFLFKREGRVPDIDVPINTNHEFNNYEEKPKITWLGHSSIIIEIEDKKLMIDPVLSKHVSPVPYLIPSRFNKELPLKPEKIPELDYVLISHDHYDHLDYSTIKKIKDKVKLFYVPLGVGSHLYKWGVPKEKIKEFNWWEEEKSNNFLFALTPTKHFSGRRFNNRNSTLLGSWVIKFKEYSIYFSADSGYQEAFKDIGNKYGPFDLAMIETGQYNKNWPSSHMFPEESVQANIDVKGKTMMPIHWGAFTLSMHDWDEPAKRVYKAAKENNIDIITPIIGGSFIIGEENKTKDWWILQEK